jgi:uncharacterized membrane protein
MISIQIYIYKLFEEENYQYIYYVILIVYFYIHLMLIYHNNYQRIFLNHRFLLSIFFKNIHKYLLFL